MKTNLNLQHQFALLFESENEENLILSMSLKRVATRRTLLFKPTLYYIHLNRYFIGSNLLLSQTRNNVRNCYKFPIQF